MLVDSEINQLKRAIRDPKMGEVLNQRGRVMLKEVIEFYEVRQKSLQEPETSNEHTRAKAPRRTSRGNRRKNK